MQMQKKDQNLDETNTSQFLDSGWFPLSRKYKEEWNRLVEVGKRDLRGCIFQEKCENIFICAIVKEIGRLIVFF